MNKNSKIKTSIAATYSASALPKFSPIYAKEFVSSLNRL